MKYFSNINRNDNCWNKFRKKIHGLIISVFLFSATLSHAASNWKSLCHEISHEEKNWIHKKPSRKNFGPMKTHEKNFWTYQILTRKNFGETKYLRGNDGTTPTILRNPRNLTQSFPINFDLILDLLKHELCDLCGFFRKILSDYHNHLHLCDRWTFYLVHYRHCQHGFIRSDFQ